MVTKENEIQFGVFLFFWEINKMTKITKEIFNGSKNDMETAVRKFQNKKHNEKSLRKLEVRKLTKIGYD